MPDKTKIVVLGTADHLKKNLMSVILGKDVFANRTSDVKIDTYENDTYKVTFTANLYEAGEDIGKLFSAEKQHPDMCLLIVEDGFSTEEVLQKIKKLHEITKKPTEEFKVVLPLRYKREESYLFKFYTLGDLFNTLAEERNLGSAEQAHTQTSGAGSRGPTGKSLKRNHSDTKVNLVLLGMSGTGKSASGNTILGKTKFESKPSSVPITTECQEAETEINGTRVRVIDTPDIFDDDINSSDKKQHVAQCRQLCQSDPCVYLLVIHVSRFTDGERDILRKFEAAFGPEAKEQTIILFTRGEDLQSSDMSFEGFLQKCQPELKNIVDQCDRRCVLFENKTSCQHQVTELMQTVNMMLNKKQKQ